MTPSYERVIHTVPMRLDYSFLEYIFIICFWCAITIFLFTLYELIRSEISERQWRLRDLIIHMLGLAYIKKWLQNTLFLFVDDNWNEKQEKWIRESQKLRKGEKKEVQVSSTDRWLKGSLKREKDRVMKSMGTKMKTSKAIAKYECKECGNRDQFEMNIYTDIAEAAKTFCFKKMCQKCKSPQLEIVSLECELFEKG